MRILILATTAAFGIAIAAPALAQQSTAPGQQMQSEKQMQEEADKGIKTRNSGESGRPDTGSSQTTTGSGAGSETSRTPR
jgi:hypothetical protein